MLFKPFEPGVEVFGACVGAFVEAFRVFPSVLLKRLVRYGIGKTGKNNDIVIDYQAWYPQEAWLSAWEEIANEVGPRACYQIGRQAPRTAVFPPSINDMYTCIASVDVAYHMNHRKGGKVMFDPATGQKLKGIGSYGYKPIQGERRIVSVCENPYPCDFDRGLLAEMAAKFEKNGRVTHDDSAPCRKQGASSCTYNVTW